MLRIKLLRQQRGLLSYVSLEMLSHPTSHTHIHTQEFDLGLNGFSGTVPASWADGMVSLQKLALDNNPALCGSLPSLWTSKTATVQVSEFNSGLGVSCDLVDQPQDSLTVAVEVQNPVTVMTTTVVWPGGDLADLQANGGLAEQEFRLRYRTCVFCFLPCHCSRPHPVPVCCNSPHAFVSLMPIVCLPFWYSQGDSRISWGGS